jgi:hypothetical protein
MWGGLPKGLINDYFFSLIPPFSLFFDKNEKKVKINEKSL